MLHRGIIIFWRLLILGTMAILALVTSFFLFPFIGHHTPLLPAIFLCYCLLAYGLIPLLVRLFRLIVEANHVPTHVTTADGWPSDPVNIALTVKNRRHLIRAMETAGWHQADQGLRNYLREAYALLLDQPYPNAPCSKLYMFGRHQDIAFQIPIGNSPRIRHHVRFWRVDPLIPGQRQHHFWWQTLHKLVGGERELWVGAATFDKRFFGMRWRSLQLTHHIDANTNKERDYLIETLEAAGYLRHIGDVKAGEPYKFRGQNFGVSITSDGYVKLCELKRPLSLYMTKRFAAKGLASD